MKWTNSDKPQNVRRLQRSNQQSILDIQRWNSGQGGRRYKLVPTMLSKKNLKINSVFEGGQHREDVGLCS